MTTVSSVRTGFAAAKAGRPLVAAGQNTAPSPRFIPGSILLLREMAHYLTLLSLAGGGMALLAGMPLLAAAILAVVLLNAALALVLARDHRAGQAVRWPGEGVLARSRHGGLVLTGIVAVAAAGIGLAFHSLALGLGMGAGRALILAVGVTVLLVLEGVLPTVMLAHARREHPHGRHLTPTMPGTVRASSSATRS